MKNIVEQARLPVLLQQGGITRKEGSGSIFQPSEGTWESVIREGNIGTAVFPQAYFVQGLRIARAFGIYANRDGLPISTFFAIDPPAALVEDVIGESKIKAHT